MATLLNSSPERARNSNSALVYSPSMTACAKADEPGGGGVKTENQLSRRTPPNSTRSKVENGTVDLPKTDSEKASLAG
ncbi:hypothetical protein MFIFM68171_01846 [Madurella fahalii]|uniref:Uncharacterized protein n=1 Tax=Madurella fahalii TaxID=1157608 RepID=A0ABQ0G1K2_9PEZI